MSRIEKYMEEIKKLDARPPDPDSSGVTPEQGWRSVAVRLMAELQLALDERDRAEQCLFVMNQMLADYEEQQKAAEGRILALQAELDKTRQELEKRKRRK